MILAILPEGFALDFLRFCLRNPKPCPLVGVGETGDPMLPTLGSNIDIRSDVPRYRIFRNGTFDSENTDISSLWADDLVTVALGCSFTFENALIRAGIPVRHIEMGRNVPMFRTNINLVPSGPFSGKMVVTMRPLREEQIEAAKASAQNILRHMAPQLHLATLHPLEFPTLIDLTMEIRLISNLTKYLSTGTPQNVLRAAQLPLCITHAPGHMLITDVSEEAETTIFPQRTTRSEK